MQQYLAAIHMLCDWLVVGQVIASNPAAPARGPRHVVRKGKTAMLAAEEARTLLYSIPGDTVVGMRDRALIALMVYTFARVGAVIKLRSEDVYAQGRRTWVRLHEKGGKRHEMPCHHSLDAYLTECTPEHSSAAARRIERAWGVVVADSAISLRQERERPAG